MTIEELYGKVMADDGLKAELAEAAREGRVVEWAATQGVEATEEELLAYAGAAADDGQELTDEQLDKVAGGGFGTGTLSVLVIFAGHYDPSCF